MLLLAVIIGIIATNLYCDKINSIICKWCWDYAAIEYELCKRYEIYRKIVAFAYDFDKMKKLSIKLSITIECISYLYSFVKVCYIEYWC